MTLRTWGIYSTTTGLFTGRHFLCFESEIARNIPEGCEALQGRYDRFSQRVDVETGIVVAYERPKAEVDAEARSARDLHARRRIEQLERAQHRPLREAQLDPANADAHARLAQIESEIAELRADLSH